MTFLDSCYDPQVDGTPAAVGNVRIPLKSGDVYEGRPISKFFVEGAFLFIANQCLSFGFVQDSTERRFAASWRSPDRPGVMWGVLDFERGKFITNAKNNFARQGFGMLGLGAAFLTRSSDFRAAWVNYLTAVGHTGAAAINAETMGWLAAAAGQGLAASVPASNVLGWVLETVPEETPAPAVEDLRHYFALTDDFLRLAEAFDAPPEYETRFQGPQLTVVRNLLRRRKHAVLLGPPGVGKTISAFEALALEGYTRAGVDYQLFSGHDEVKSADFLGSWQPSGNPDRPFIWANGCLVRAMTAHGGRGQPILVEEFTRMPTRAQNMFISALSDGYVVLNEKPNPDGDGEIIRAGEDFVLLADMNVDPSADDLELYGAAFASRVRKVEYDYPSTAGLMQIVEQDVPETTPAMRTGIAGVYGTVMAKWTATELAQPISPRACVQWAEEIVALTDEKSRLDSTIVRAAAWQGATLTWLRDVTGTDAKLRKTLSADVEAQFRKSYSAARKV